MRTRTTVILALALALASVLAWWDTPKTAAPANFDGSEDGPTDQSPDQIVRLLTFSAASIQQITLQRGSFNAVLTRTPEGWAGIPPSEAGDEFLRGLQELAQIIVVGHEQGGPADFGLDPPVARVTLGRSDGDPIELRIGNANPSSTGVYAQVGAQGPVVLTGALALWDLDKVVRRIQSAATPTPPATTDGAQIVDHSGKWESGYGATFFNIVGTVHNDGASPLAWVKIQADLLDATRDVVANATVYNYQAESPPNESGEPASQPRPDAQPIAPGQSDRFRVSFLKEETPAFATYRVAVIQQGSSPAGGGNP